MAYFSPLGNGFAFVDSNGNPLSGALLFTYVAGSSTKQTTYKNEGSSSSHTNPIVLDANGRAPDPIWLTAGVSYKFVLAPSNDTDPPASPIETWDDIDGVNDTTVTVDQWVSGPTPTYVSATQFTLVGDQTSTFHAGRRLKLTDSGGTDYATITTSAYGALTTVTVSVDASGVLDAGLSAVSYALIGASNTSVPGVKISGSAWTHQGAVNFAEGSDVVSAGTIDIWSTTGNTVHVTGSTGPITSVGTAPQAGAMRWVIFDSTPTLTHGANLNLPDALSYTVYAGQRVLFYADTTTQIDVFPMYPRALGDTADKGAGTFNATGLYVSGVQNLLGDCLLRDVTENSFNNTTTETTVFTDTVPANSLNTNRMLRITMLARAQDNDAGTSTITIRLKFGGSTLCAIVLTHTSASGTIKPVRVVAEIAGQNATNAQTSMLHGVLSAPVALGGSGGALEDQAISQQESAVDSTSSQTLAVTVQMGTANAAIIFNCKNVQVELI